MVDLKNTVNVMRGRVMASENKDPLTEISAIGDGNCAFNAFALGLIDLIQRDQCDLSDENFEALCQQINLPILNARVALYQGDVSPLKGNAYRDLVKPLEAFIDTFSSPPTKEAFIAYVKQQTTREAIAALHVGLAPALRAMAIEAYQKTPDPLLTDITARNQEAEAWKEDGISAGEDVLMPLAESLHIHLSIYSENRPPITTQPHVPSDQSKIALLHRENHWNVLIPTAQTDGLSRLPQADQPFESIASLPSLDALSARLSARLNETPATAKQALQDAGLAIEKITLLLMEEQANNPKTTLSQTIQQTAQASTQMVKTAQKQLSLTRETLAPLFSHPSSKHDVAKLQIDLLLSSEAPPHAAPLDHDEALARSLQNAEILTFLSRQYDALKPDSGPNPSSKRFGK
ncbi:MAG: hypothetical protein A3E85_01955 [Gammaproteobacteria bacterium RIFCSPHIGHO2_12_FULL_45_12]|nr:MAG: hypothetical protein A3E85_01955 [Gammaproteobacteria bacterium RIFCSPHIGHO2_12_FULL_45_12]